MTPGAGNPDPRNAFLKFITQPEDGVLVRKEWLNSTATRIASRVFDEGQADEELVKETVQDVLLQMMAQDSILGAWRVVLGKKDFEPHQNPRYFMGNEKSWSNFKRDFQNNLRRKLIDKRETLTHEQQTKTLLAGDVAALDSPPDSQAVYSAQQGSKWLRTAIDSLPVRTAKIIVARYLGKKTLDAVGFEEGLSRAGVGHIESKGMRYLVNSLTPDSPTFVGRNAVRNPTDRGIE